MYFGWSPAIAVGVDEIDEQHKDLLLRLEVLIEAIARADATRIAPLFDSLRERVVSHFRSEERLMGADYPGYLLHREAHEAFLASLDAARGELQSGSRLAAVEWVIDWLKTHMAGSDRELGRYLLRPSNPAPAW